MSDVEGLSKDLASVYERWSMGKRMEGMGLAGGRSTKGGEVMSAESSVRDIDSSNGPVLIKSFIGCYLSSELFEEPIKPLLSKFRYS
jgi:hypothetical protein